MVLLTATFRNDEEGDLLQMIRLIQMLYNKHCGDKKGFIVISFAKEQIDSIETHKQPDDTDML